MVDRRSPEGTESRLRVALVITRGERGGAQVHVRDLVLGLRDQVRYHVYVGEDGFLADELRGASIPVTLVPDLQRAVQPRTDLQAVRALRRHLRDERPDVVHTHSTKAGLLGRGLRAPGCAGDSHRACVVVFGWSVVEGKAAAIPVEWLAGRLTDRFITVSEADREVGERYGVVRRPQARIIHNGVPVDAPFAMPSDTGTPVIITVARLAPPKDLAVLLQALSTVRSPSIFGWWATARCAVRSRRRRLP